MFYGQRKILLSASSRTNDGLRPPWRTYLRAVLVLTLAVVTVLKQRVATDLSLIAGRVEYPRPRSRRTMRLFCVRGGRG